MGSGRLTSIRSLTAMAARTTRIWRSTPTASSSGPLPAKAWWPMCSTAAICTLPAACSRADEHKETLLAELLAFADSRGCRPTFYNIAENDLPLFARLPLSDHQVGRRRAWSICKAALSRASPSSGCAGSRTTASGKAWSFRKPFAAACPPDAMGGACSPNWSALAPAPLLRKRASGRNPLSGRPL